MKFPNIYESRHYKLFPIIPIALLIMSLFLIPHIQLDTSLRGGVSIQLQSNSTIPTKSLSAMIDSRIPGAEASVTKAGDSFSIVIAANTSISNAHNILLSIYSLNRSYSNSEVALVEDKVALSSSPSNTTISREISALEQNQTGYIASMNSTLAKEMAALSQFTGGSNESYNGSDAVGMVAKAQWAYATATAKYKSSIMGYLGSIMKFPVYSYNDVTPTLGAFFLKQLKGIIIWSFILVAIAVFVIFRNPIPSLTVVFGSANDIIVALGAMALFGIPLGVASVGGLLMLIGYSMDTDVLSAIRILKRAEETPEKRAFGAMKTGMTLTTAAIITFTILLITSYVVFIPTYFEISAVVLAGLVADLVTTWLGNTPLLLWYKKEKEVS
jgi:preprotein translocase subunit SecF